MKILADASLPDLQNTFPAPFQLTVYQQQQEIPDLLAGQEILLCRSTLKVNESLLSGSSLRFVCTASSGIDHIDEAALHAKNIQLIDAKGSNARSVAEYMLACLHWLQANAPLRGNKAGIIGMGAVGTRVAKNLEHAGFTVIAYDPPKAAQGNFSSCSLAEIATCDLICIHASLHDTPPWPSRNLLDPNFFVRLSPHTTIINAARGSIVDEQALLDCRIPFTYCTDVYSNEPAINEKIIARASLCTPHIAGHSQEAKYRAVHCLGEKLHKIYNLQPPFLKPPEQETVLPLYNPYLETLELKQANNKQLAFLDLRKAHLRFERAQEPLKQHGCS